MRFPAGIVNQKSWSVFMIAVSLADIVSVGIVVAGLTG